MFGAALGVLAASFLVLAAAPWVGVSGAGRRPLVGRSETRIGAAVRDAARQGFRVTDLVAYVLGLLGLGTLAQAAGATASALSVPSYWGSSCSRAWW